MEKKIKLGISSCLLGNQVRYDGQYQYDSWLVEELGPYVEFMPVCPFRVKRCAGHFPAQYIGHITRPGHTFDTSRHAP